MPYVSSNAYPEAPVAKGGSLGRWFTVRRPGRSDGGDDLLRRWRCPAAVRVINTADGKRRVVCFAEDDEVTVDPDSAAFIIWEEYPRLRESVLAGQYTPGSAAQFYLRFGVIQLAKGKGALYHRMMQRGQTYHQIGLTGDQTMEGL